MRLRAGSGQRGLQRGHAFSERFWLLGGCRLLVAAGTGKCQYPGNEDGNSAVVDFHFGK